MRLTIGIPVFDDLPGLQWTCTSLIQNQDLTDAEILVVDNHPTYVNKGGKLIESDDTRDLHRYVDGIEGRYIPLAAPTGTAPPRNLAFQEAKGDVVLVLDSHVSLQPGALTRVLDYFDTNPSPDIVCGPRHGKNKIPGQQRLAVAATHYADVWRKEMWGIWAQAWGCPCGNWNFDVEPVRRSAVDGGVTVQGGSLVVMPAMPELPPACGYRELKLGRPAVAACPACGKEVPPLPYIQHEEPLEKAGYLRRGWSACDSQPFEITGLGLGMFAMRKSEWPGFPAEMTGFGGGELHLHELVRRNGGKAMCLPQAGWWHCFYRSAGKVPYRLHLWDKVRNYVLWRNRLELPLDIVHQHFVVDLEKLTQPSWEYLIADPVKHTEAPAAPKPNVVRPEVKVNGRPLVPDWYKTIEQAYTWVKTTKRDCIENLDEVAALVKICPRVVALVKRREWDFAVLKGKPEYFASHNTEQDGTQELLKKLVTDTAYHTTQLDSLAATPEPCDMLLIDTVHTADRLAKELAAWGPHVSRFILLRGTKTFGEFAEGSKKGAEQPGLLVAAHEFMKANPKWHRASQSDAQYGLTVLSSDPKDKDIDQEPGTHLHLIFDSLGVKMAEGCGCRKRIAQMNDWGVQGCKEHKQEIVEALKKDQDKYSWGVQFKAAFGTLKTGLIFKINPLDPLPGLVDEAIRRSEAYAKQYAALFV